MATKFFGNDMQVRSYFASHYPMIFGASTKFAVPAAMLDLLDRFASELMNSGNAYAIRDIRWQSMRLFFNRGTTSAQLAISERYIEESMQISREEDIYADHQGDFISPPLSPDRPGQYIDLACLPAQLLALFIAFLEAEGRPQPADKNLAYTASFKSFLKHQFPNGAEHEFSRQDAAALAGLESLLTAKHHIKTSL